MKIAFASPFAPRELWRWLDLDERDIGRLPRGMWPPPLAATPLDLLERGHEVTVYTFDPTVDRELRFAGRRCRLVVLPYRDRHRARDLFRTERGLLSAALGRDRPDVVHAHWTYEYALGALDAGLPHVVTAHDAPWRIWRYHFTPYRAVLLAMAALVARRARLMTAVSPSVARHFERRLGFRGPVHVIPNGLRLPVPTSATALDPDPDPFVFVAAPNGWGGWKNVETLLLAFREVRAAHPHARLDLIGAGAEPGGPAESWARARRAAEHVRFLGPMPNAALLDHVTERAHALVHPSLEESFSFTLAEAMIRGVPVIGGRFSGGVPFTLGDGRAGRLADVRSAPDLADAMREFVERPTRRLELARAGLDFAREHFDSRRVTDRYETLYREARP